MLRDRLEDQALLGLPGDDALSAAAAGNQSVAVIDPQPPGRLVVGRVAVVAVVDEQRPDPSLEELDLGGIVRIVRGGRGVESDAPQARDRAAKANRESDMMSSRCVKAS